MSNQKNYQYTSGAQLNDPPPPYGHQSQSQGYYAPVNTVDQSYTFSNAPETCAANRWAGFSDSEIRRGFIRKVYAILTIQLAVTFGLTALCILNNSVKTWIQMNRWAYYLAYVIFLCVYITLVCCKGPRRVYPYNMILLGVFTLSFSYMMAMITSYHNIMSILIAAGITSVCCLTVSLLSIWTKFDFTRFWWALFIAGIGFSLMGFVILILFYTAKDIKIIYIVYAGIGTVLFMLYLAFDTQLICGGKKYELNPEEYVLGAVLLYIDIVYIFIYILTIISASKD